MYLEDAIWTQIRIAPDALPLGEIEMIPGSFYTTLRMVKIGAKKAIAKLANTEDGDRGAVSQYTVNYPSLNRTLSISFNRNFPHDILSWSESYPSGLGDNLKMLTTKAYRTHAVMNDYWNKNNTTDIGLRGKLGLPK